MAILLEESGVEDEEAAHGQEADAGGSKLGSRGSDRDQDDEPVLGGRWSRGEDDRGNLRLLDDQ